jgi:HD superfamily phosphodiesterase
MLFGFIIASKIPSLADRDLEVHAIGALMHDIGWDPTGELVSKDKRFEVDGADAARNFLRRRLIGINIDCSKNIAPFIFCLLLGSSVLPIFRALILVSLNGPF